jgi:hypothetical protein
MNSLFSLIFALLLVALTCHQNAFASRSNGPSLQRRRTTLSRLMQKLNVPDYIPDDVRINVFLNMEGF